MSGLRWIRRRSGLTRVDRGRVPLGQTRKDVPGRICNLLQVVVGPEREGSTVTVREGVKLLGFIEVSKGYRIPLVFVGTNPW